jgi:hypothetical protein
LNFSTTREDVTPPQSLMPKKANISKKAAAQFQNKKAILKALNGTKEEVTFAAVERAMGFAKFGLRVGAYSVEGTPRGLFTSGTMRVSVGDIVIVDGYGTTNARGEQMIVEIVGRLEKQDIKDLLSSGILRRETVSAAKAASSMAACEEPETDDEFFEREEDDLGQDDIWGKEGPKSKKKALAVEQANAATSQLLQKLASGTSNSTGTSTVREVTLDDL